MLVDGAAEPHGSFRIPSLLLPVLQDLDLLLPRYWPQGTLTWPQWLTFSSCLGAPSPNPDRELTLYTLILGPHPPRSVGKWMIPAQHPRMALLREGEPQTRGPTMPLTTPLPSISWKTHQFQGPFPTDRLVPSVASDAFQMGTDSNPLKGPAQPLPHHISSPQAD